MGKSLRVLMVEDSENDVLLTIRALKQGGYDPVYERVETAEAMQKALREKPWDVILCDYDMPKFNGLAAIAQLKEAGIDIPLIIVSGAIGEKMAVECMRLGARDYVMKNNLSRLASAIERELQEAESRFQHKQAEEALWKSEQKFRVIFDNASDGILIADPITNKFSHGNNAICSMLGCTKEEIKNLTIYDIHLPKDIPHVFDKFQKLAKGEKIFSKELPVLRRDGSIFYADIAASPVIIGEATCFLGIFRDVTERKKAEESLRESEERYRNLSIVDDLTQLYNSRHFYHQLKMEIDRTNRYGQPLTLLLLDLDDFKQFNDAYGHIEGDQVLLRLGQVVKRCLRQTDSAYRYGGEEFTILLPMTTVSDGAVIAERIRTELKKEHFSPMLGHNVHVTVSIGVAQYKLQEDIKTFVHRVDQLMYQGKKNGKDEICSEL